jgi:ElaB/YqjD/DUF883 family membrane-anchored ribosome-binding protein
MNPTTVRERVVDAMGQAAQVAHDARLLKARASEAIEDGVHAAKRAVTRGAHEIEDLRDAAAYRVRRAPLGSIALAAGAGLFLGIVLGRLGRNRSRAEARA